MTKRPMCLFTLLFMGVILCLNQMGIPLFGNSPPVLPEVCFSHEIEITGRVYETESNSFYTILYLKQVSLDIESDNYPIENVKANIKNTHLQEVPYPGMKVRMTGVIGRIPLPSNPGQFNERNYYYARKIKWFLDGDTLDILDTNEGMLMTLRRTIRDSAKKSLEETAWEETKGLFCAMLLGVKKEVGQENTLLFRISSLSHLLAVSGTHISFLGWGLYKMLRKVRIPPIGAGIAAGVIMIQYGLLTGSSASALRAVIMFLMALTALAVGRTYDLLSALALSAVILLIDSPGYLYDSSFQMSFGALIGLSVVKPALEEWAGKKAGTSAIFQGFLAGVSVQMILLPVQMYWFCEISTYGFLVNLLLLPTAGVVLLSGICGCAAGFFSSLAGKLLLLPGNLLLEIYLWTGRILKKIPYSMVITGAPALWKCIVYYAMLLICFFFFGQGSSRKKKILRVCCLAFGVSLLFFRLPDKNLYITTLDVGQGDCHTVRQGNCVYLIDGGSSDVSKPGTYRILPFLRWSKIRYVDGIFLSHMDEDHINGVKEILEAIAEKNTSLKVGRLFLSENTEKREELMKIEHLAEMAGCQVIYIKKGDVIKNQVLQIQCLYPEDGEGESNENSQVLYVRYGNFDALFTGDMEGEGERAVAGFLEKNRISAKILKTAHHGSKYSTGEKLLEAVKPEGAVISCGADNSYGHPHKELLERLERRNIRIFTTPVCGAVQIVSDGQKTVITSQY